jgi:hypothetical protein
MSTKIKNIVTTVAFSAFIAVFAVLCIVRAFNPVLRSEEERRDLAQFPTDFTWEELLNNKVTVDAAGNEVLPPIKQFENYTVDQFPLRQFFRNIKLGFAMGVLNVKENNGYVKENGSVTTVTSAYTEKQLEALKYQISVLNKVYDRYLAGNGGNHYLAIIPDKNYYLGEEYGYPTPDYDGLVEQMKNALSGMEYVDLFGSLELEDYYKTDWHWDQSKLDGVMATLGDAMGFGDRISGHYTENVLEGFLGGYHDQSALYPAAENMVYLTNDILNGCRVYDYENGKSYGLYNHELYTSKTPYDFFLSGTRALLRIDNPNATTKDRLIVLRDSYGASLVPLMAEGYASIYVVDLRYVHPDVVTRMIGQVKGADVLFALSTTVLSSKNFK